MAKRSTRGRRPPSASASRRPRRPAWASLEQEELLDLRLCDLGVSLRGTALERRVSRLQRELAAAGLAFRPYVWLSTDWFTPDGATGFALPFYLAHPRLLRLERSMMLEAEGGTHDHCMRLLRHEAAHALDHAFRLHRRARWRQVFGKAGTPYRQSYTPNPASKRYVLNLDRWYSQSHPIEDFAETFAVWLRPGSRWRKEYAGWPALAKLRYVDELMGELRGAEPPVSTRRTEEPLERERSTLRQHYQQKRARYAVDVPSVHDSVLHRLFVPSRATRHGSAGRFLRDHGTELRRRVSAMTGQHPYVVDQVLSELVPRCKQLGLYLARSPRETMIDAAIVLTSATLQSMTGHPTYAR